MLIQITFHANDDLSDEYKERIEGICLHAVDVPSVTWTYGRPGFRHSWIMKFRTERKIEDQIEDFEKEGFYLDEFVEFAIRP